jgi:NitT/TauT family transport system substrate-binding protein
MRSLRAILKATDLCGTEPERAARRLVEGGFTDNVEHARQALD